MTPKSWYIGNGKKVPGRAFFNCEYLSDRYTLKFFVIPGADADTIINSYKNSIMTTDSSDIGKVEIVYIMIGGNIHGFDSNNHLFDADITFFSIKDLVNFISAKGVLADGARGVKNLLPPPRHDNPKYTNYGFYLQALHSNLLKLPKNLYNKDHRCKDIYGPRFSAIQFTYCDFRRTIKIPIAVNCMGGTSPKLNMMLRVEGYLSMMMSI